VAEEAKYIIKLDSPLDINSNDMLVPVTQPKFSFNRQRLLGSVLQNSVRYEADGWFAGWWVHNFNLVTIGSYSVVPDGLGTPTIQDRLVPADRNAKYWSVRFRDVELEFSFSVAGWQNVISGSNLIITRNGDIVTITGNTTFNDTFTANVNAYTGSVISFTPSNPELMARGFFKNGIFTFIVEKTPGSDNIYVRFGENLMLDEQMYPYTFDGTTHAWGTLFSLAGNTVSLDDTTDYDLIAQVLNFQDTVDEYFDVTLRSKGTFTMASTVNTMMIGGYDYFSDYRYDTSVSGYAGNLVDPNTTPVTATSLVNTRGIEFVDSKSGGQPTPVMWDDWCIIKLCLPIWMRIAQNYTFKFQVEIGERVILPPTIDPISGDVVAINSYAWCRLFVDIQRNGKSSSIHQVINDLALDWRITLGNVSFLDSQIPDDGTSLKVALTEFIHNDAIPLSWALKIEAFNTSADPWFPVPNGYVYGTINYGIELHSDLHIWTKLRPPPPKWLPFDTAYQDYMWNAAGKPVDWENPVRPPLAWPDVAERPTDWQLTTTAWPTTRPTGWPTNAAGNAAWASLTAIANYGGPLTAAQNTTWAANTGQTYQAYYTATKPSWWPDTPVVPVTVWPLPWDFGVTPPTLTSFWSSATPYATWIQAYEPVDWPIPWSGVQWPTVDDTPSSWEPVWPIDWPYGITLEPPGWYSIGTAYLEKVTSWIPYKAPAPNTDPIPWEDGGDPGYEWPSEYAWPAVVESGYVISNTPPVGWPLTVMQDLEARGIMYNVVLGPDVTNDGYNYVVLNRRTVVAGDRHIFNYTNGWAMSLDFNNIFPICIYGYVYNIITTVDITNFQNGALASGAVAFLILPIPNQLIGSGIKRFRLDNNALFPGSATYSLDVVRTAIRSVSGNGSTPIHGVSSPYTILIEYTGSGSFDKVIDYQYAGAPSPFADLQNQLPISVIEQYGFYPAWVAASEGSVWWKKYAQIGVAANGIYSVVDVNITSFEWITGGMKATVTYVPNSRINQRLALDLANNTLTPIIPSGQQNAWAPGVFTESVKWLLDRDRNIYVQYDRAIIPQTGTYAFVPADVSPWYDPTFMYGPYQTPEGTRPAFVATLKRSEIVHVSLYRAFIISALGLMVPAVIVSADKEVITFNSPFGWINRNGKWADYIDLDLVGLVLTQNTLLLQVNRANKFEVNYIPAGIFWYNKYVRFISIDGSIKLVFEYEGVEYTLTLGSDLQEKLIYSVTDIRDGQYRELAAERTTNIRMAVKQFWSNDIDIENYWWVDSSHVLVLSRYNMSLYEKIPGELDDWMGDRWHVIKEAPRGNFLQQEDLYYTVTCAFNARPVFMRIRNNDPQVSIFYIDVLTVDFATLSPESNTWTNVNIPVRKLTLVVGIPQALPMDAMGAFVPIDINALLCSGRISSTVIDDKLMIGFALSRGMLQWTCIINGGSFRIVNGYGHVGHDGSLTGGQYPAQYCNVNGFAGGVYSLDGFKDNSGANPQTDADNKIFGSGSALWFVCKFLQGIVTHYTYEGGVHVMQTIPLINNYATVHDVSGHKTIVLFDLELKHMGIVDLFTLLADEGDTTLGAVLSTIGAVLLPSVWYGMPQLGSAVFASQGMHQAAYVIRNSLPVRSEDGKSDKDNSVVRRVKECSMSLNVGRISTLVSIILSLTGSALSAMSEDNLSVEASKNASTTSDTVARRLGQFATQATLDGISTALATKGLVLSAKTKVVEQMSLSMFYSINDGSQCFAGPGFVNHQFIGQLVSQGNSAARFKLEKFGAYIPLKFITEILAQINMMIAKAILEALEKANGSSGGSTGGFAAGSGGMSGGIMYPILLVAIQVAKANVQIQQILADIVPGLYQALGETARGFYTGGADRNVIEPEATHSYGNKPMSFFWPIFGRQTKDTIEGVEYADCGVEWAPIQIKMAGLNLFKTFEASGSVSNTTNVNNDFFHGSPPLDGNLYLPKDVTIPRAYLGDRSIPEDMACVEGIVHMLQADSSLKNLQVNCVDYVFQAPPIHDFIISKEKDIGVQATWGEAVAYSMGDTKLMDGPASNIIEDGAFFALASSYVALEIKNYDHDYLRPWAVTPTCVGLNITGFNCVQTAKIYHGFEGQFNRITGWKGGNGLDSATGVEQYCFVVNDHFKRSNIVPPSEFFGLFEGPPQISMTALGKDIVANQVMDSARQKGIDINIPGEDRDLRRYSIPVHAELLSTLPATVRMLGPYKLHVIDGITSLTTDLRNTQTRYKAPTSVDFNVYDKMYRATEEYIALITLKNGVIAPEDKYPTAGLSFIGATTKEAFFYSSATRMYYTFTGDSITKRDIFNRFKSIKNGRWDFVNQEVVFKALFNDNILNNDVDGNFIMRLDDKEVAGEMYAPNATIYNQRSDFKILSMAGGLVYQGPKRCAVNRWVITDDMYNQIKQNKRKWKKLDREEWAPGRDYLWHYDNWYTDAPVGSIYGWTHNPWRAATAMLGIDEETDCVFEWELTFAWTEQIERVFEQNEFVSFNVAGETISQGGTLLSRPTHIFLFKELFKNGYYSMRYSSRNGSGNRERLYMWGDGMVAIEGLAIYTKEITKRRAQPLATSQVDVQELHEQ
jgi:hypothetical protein